MQQRPTVKWVAAPSCTKGGKSLQNGVRDERFIQISLGTAVRGWTRLVLLVFTLAVGCCAGHWLLGSNKAFGQVVVETLTFQARVTYRYGSVPVTQLFSNPVEIQVAESRRLALLGEGGQFASPGGQAVFPIEVVNIGNVVDSYVLQAAVEGENVDVLWYYAPSEAAAPDATWRPVATDQQSGGALVGPLAPGTKVSLLVAVSIPPGTERGMRDFIVHGVSISDPTASASIAIPLYVTSAVPYLEIVDAPDYVYAGDTYELRLRYGNRGEEALPNMALVLLLPPEAHFSAASYAGEYDAVRHAVRWDVGSVAQDEGWAIDVQLRADDGFVPDVSLEHVAVLEQMGAPLLEATAWVELATRAPARITVTAEPTLIRADGVSRSTVIAEVVDSIGMPVTDGTLVVFHTPRGAWQGAPDGAACGAAGPGDCIMVPTVGGIAQAELLADVGEAAAWNVVPITVAVSNPYRGEVTAQVNVFFASGAIVGRVFDYGTGFPDSGVEVWLTRLDANGHPSGEPMVQYTDEFGYYMFGAAEGDYIITVFRNTRSGVSAIEMPRLTVTDAAGSITFAPRIVVGRLVDGISAHVELVGPGDELLAATQTDEHGNYVLILDDAVVDASSRYANGSALDSGWHVRARTEDGRVAVAFLREAQPGELIVNVNLSVETWGQVIDALTGKPIPGAEVALLWASPPWEDDLVELPPLFQRAQANPAITDINGNYVFEVEPGYYRLQVKAPGYHTLRTEPFLTPRARLTHELALTPLGSAVLRVEKQATPVFSRPGDRVTFTVIVQNVTDQPVNDIEVMALLPEGMSPIIESAPMQPMLIDVSTLVWKLESLAPGEPFILGYEAIIGEGLEGAQLVSYANARLRNSDEFAVSSVVVRVGNWPALQLTAEAPAQAAIGDIVSYRLRLRNTSDDVTTTSTTIETRLPQGMHYIEGSTLLGGADAGDPIRSGDLLVWEIGTVEPGAEHTLIYRAAVGLDSVRSDGVHMARARGEVVDGYVFETNWDIAQTEIVKELFGAEGQIMGRVIPVEGNEQGGGIDSVRLDGMTLLLDDGRRTTTDDQGMFVFDAVAPGVHSIKILESSLMPGTTVVHFQDGEVAGEPARLGGWSRFVDVRPNTTAFITVYIADASAESGSSVHAAHPLNEVEHGSDQVVDMLSDSERTDTAERQAPVFISPAAGAALHGRLATVVVESRLDDAIELWVNGNMVPHSQIGEWLEDPANNLQRRTYYNVALQEGPNVLSLTGDADRVEQTVYVVGQPARAELVSAPSAVPYREVRDIPIELLVTDRHGFPVADGTIVTLSVIGAETVEPDVYPDQPGYQTRVQNGYVRMTLRVIGAASQGLSVELTGVEGKHVVELPTKLLPSPLLLAGLIDVRLPLYSLASARWDSSVIYSQGFANGGTLVARYDTRKSWHPPHGSIQSGTTQTSDLTPSADPLYIRYESESGYVLYGDYSPSVGVASRYTQRRGNVTGLQSAWKTAAGQLGMYAFAQRGEQHIEEFPLSVIGTFDLSHTPIVAGSEEVWLVRKDASLDMEVGRERLLRDRDYELDHALGIVRIKHLFPASLRMGERLFVEVVYTTPSYGGSGSSFGVQYTPWVANPSQTPGLTISWAAEREGDGHSDVIGVTGQLHAASAALRLSYDIAVQLKSPAGGSAGMSVDGTAGELRLQWQHIAPVELDVRHQWAAGQFWRPGADKPLSEERRTIGTARLTLAEISRAELTRAITHSVKDGAAFRDELRLWQQLSSRLGAHLGLRSAGSSAHPFGSDRQWTAMAGASWQISDRSHLELSQELDLSSSLVGGLRWGQANLRYAHTWGNGVVTSIQFANGGAAASGGWTVAAESSPEAGPSVYGYYQWQEEQVLAEGKSVVGIADEWEVVPGLHLGLAAESTSELNGAGDRVWDVSGTWHAEYVYASDQSVGIEQQLVRRENREQRSLRMWASGTALPGMRYGFEATWLSGHLDRMTSDPLKHILEGEVSYREPLADRYFGNARYVYKVYETPGIHAAPLNQKSTGVWFVEGGVRTAPDTTWYAHWAQKRTTAPVANDLSFTISLRQIGFQKQLLERWGVDLFVRHLSDSGGASLHGGGMEVVFALTPDVGIGFGYSSLGANDPDLHHITAWPEGWYIRLRMKF